MRAHPGRSDRYTSHSVEMNDNGRPKLIGRAIAARGLCLSSLLILTTGLSSSHLCCVHSDIKTKPPHVPASNRSSQANWINLFSAAGTPKRPASMILATTPAIPRAVTKESAAVSDIGASGFIMLCTIEPPPACGSMKPGTRLGPGFVSFSGHRSISNRRGSSRASLTRTRKVTAPLPSTMRWS